MDSGVGIQNWNNPFNPFRSSTQGSTAQQIKVGALSFVYVFHWFSILMFCLSLATLAAGLSSMEFNIQNAFLTWTYWRYWGLLIFSTMLPLSMAYFLYQERKSMKPPGQATTFSSSWDRTWVRINYFFYTVTLLVLGAFWLVCMIWISVDAGQCTSAQCQGWEKQVTPCRAMIMVLAGGWGCIVFVVIAFILSLYVHAAARDLWAANHSILGGGFLSLMGAPIRQIWSDLAMDEEYTEASAGFDASGILPAEGREFYMGADMSLPPPAAYRPVHYVGAQLVPAPVSRYSQFEDGSF